MYLIKMKDCDSDNEMVVRKAPYVWRKCLVDLGNIYFTNLIAILNPEKRLGEIGNCVFNSNVHFDIWYIQACCYTL